MRKLTLALAAAALTATSLPTLVQAQDANPLSFNIGATSDYRYRGISQSRKNAALQGGIDYAHSSGFYVGTWLSTIKWIKDAGGGADVESDFYGGYKGAITSSLGYDVGVLRYQYFGHDLPVSPNTTELYGALTFGPATLKYSHSVTNLFGVANSKNSNYIDLSATFDVGGGFSLTPHIGHQKIRNNSVADYTDYSLTLNKAYYGFLFGVAYVGTDTNAYVSPNGKNLGKDGLVVSVKRSF